MSILITCIGSAPAEAVARSLKDYNIIGIDMKEICVGTFVSDTYIQIKDKTGTEEYWNKVKNIITEHDVRYVFVSLPLEADGWSRRKDEFMEKYNCEVFLNNTKFCTIANNKRLTYEFCTANDINIPLERSVNDRPIVIKDINGAGSVGLQILKDNDDTPLPFQEDRYIIQQFIDGDEYTVDVLSDPDGRVVNIVPKLRCFVKNGQSFVSRVSMHDDVVEFVKDVALKMDNRSLINVQVIKEHDTGDIYLVEVNPRYPTSISLTIRAGVDMPRMLVENDYIMKDVCDGLTMTRGYREYYSKGCGGYEENVLNVVERDCLVTSHDKNIKSSKFDKYIFIKLRENISKFQYEMRDHLLDKKNILEIGVYWGEYKGAKQMYPELNIKSADIDPNLNPDCILDITKRCDFDDSTFDAIICLEVLEHTRDPMNGIREMSRLLSKNGLLFISIPCNYRIHSPKPDSFRFTHHFFHVIAEDHGFEIKSLKCIEDKARYLFPLHYTCILKKT